MECLYYHTAESIVTGRDVFSFLFVFKESSEKILCSKGLHDVSAKGEEFQPHQQFLERDEGKRPPSRAVGPPPFERDSRHSDVEDPRSLGATGLLELLDAGRILDDGTVNAISSE